MALGVFPGRGDSWPIRRRFPPAPPTSCNFIFRGGMTGRAHAPPAWEQKWGFVGGEAWALPGASAPPALAREAPGGGGDRRAGPHRPTPRLRDGVPTWRVARRGTGAILGVL